MASQITEDVMKWMPIESAPKDGTDIDLWMSGPSSPEGYREPMSGWDATREEWMAFSDYWGEVPIGRMVGDAPTHWMPLPEPPNED